MTPVSLTDCHGPPAPGAFSKPGSVGIFGKVDTATLGCEPPLGGPKSATNGSTRPAPCTGFAFTTGTGVVLTGGGVDVSSGRPCTGPGAGTLLEHATNASAIADNVATASVLM